MRTPSIVPAGGFYLENGLPDEYYAFTDGELSMTVERCGGINTLQVLDILEFGGKLYPDRAPTPPIVFREGGHCGKRVLYGPGIQFISTSRGREGRPGRVLHHFPDRTELYPFGFRSDSERFGHRLAYDLCIDGRAVLCRFANAFPERDSLVMTINKEHLRSGEMGSLKQQGLSPVWPGMHGPTARRKGPGDAGGMTLSWSAIGYDGEANAFRMDGEMRFAYGAKPVAVVVLGSRPMGFRDLRAPYLDRGADAASAPMNRLEPRSRYLLSFPWHTDNAEDEIRLALVVGEDRKAALRQARALVAEGRGLVDRKVAAAVEYARRAPRVAVAGLPAAAEYARALPAFERAMVLAETDDEACIRAATHRYGYFAGWDQVYPARTFLALGDHALAKKLVRYHFDLPNIEPLIHQLILAVEETAAFSGDREFLADGLKAFREAFLFVAESADPVTGLLRGYSSGADDPGELGAARATWPACHNGWWHGACRAIENIALRLDDAEVGAVAHAVGARLEKHYLAVFFDAERGYLHAAVDPATGEGFGVFQNVSTLAMDYPYGEYLLHKRLREIAEYQAFMLCHPNGRSAVAYDDNAHEMWKHVIMFQHLAHEAKTARAAGLGDEALRIVGNFLRLFERTKVAIETQNLCGAEGDIGQRSNWQAFACTYPALLSGVLGIQWDMGGFGYAPCDMRGAMRLEGFRFRRAIWDIRIEGEGPFVSAFAVDGRTVDGTTRLPAEWHDVTGRHELRIVRGEQPYARPTLLAAPGASVTAFRSTSDALEFTVAEPVHAPLKLGCGTQPEITLTGRPAPVEWIPDTHTAWCDATFAPGDRVRVEAAMEKPGQ